MPRRYPELKNADWLRENYIDKNRTIAELARELGTLDVTLIRAMRRLGVPSRTSAESRMLRGTGRKTPFASLEDGEWLRRKYITERLSCEEIGQLVGCTMVPVLHALRRHNIPRRKPGLLRTGRRMVTYKPELRDAAWLRNAIVSEKKTPDLIAEELGCKRRTVMARLAKIGLGERFERPRDWENRPLRTYSQGSGYIKVWAPTHPNADNRGFVLEHRLTAEKALGRLLTAQEQVHHLNERRNDNRPENLLVFPSFRAHVKFHREPPSWIPRCSCCGKPNPERLEKRPDDIPLYYG